jgi:hypothetical protein
MLRYTLQQQLRINSIAAKVYVLPVRYRMLLSHLLGLCLILGPATRYCPDQ